MRFGDEDRVALLDDFGLRLEYGSNDTKGIFDQEQRLDTDEAGMNVVTQESVVLVSAKDFDAGYPLSGLAVDDTITVDGTDYRVHDIRKVDDAAFKQIVVAEV